MPALLIFLIPCIILLGCAFLYSAQSDKIYELPREVGLVEKKEVDSKMITTDMTTMTTVFYELTLRTVNDDFITMRVPGNVYEQAVENVSRVVYSTNEDGSLNFLGFGED